MCIGICIVFTLDCHGALFQSFISSGDYDDEEDYPNLSERLEGYKSEGYFFLVSACFRSDCINEYLCTLVASRK